MKSEDVKLHRLLKAKRLLDERDGEKNGMPYIPNQERKKKHIQI